MFANNDPSFRKLSNEATVEYPNERVEVLVVFSHGTDHEKCVPRKMKRNNRTITFTELGYRHPTSKGNRMIHIFDVTDGNAQYRIEFDAESLTWTLASSVIAQ